MAWSGWRNLGTPGGRPITSTPAVASWSPNRVDVFVQGFDNALWQKIWENGRWSDWASLGGVLTSSPAAISRGPNLIDVFVRGSDNGLYRQYYSGGSWSGWAGLGGGLTSAPAVASWGQNRLDVFARGTDNALWQNSWNGTNWSGWSSLGGNLGPELAAISRLENQTDVYSRENGVVKAKVWDGVRWNDWQSTRFQLVPSPASRPPAWADWFWLDNSNHLRSLHCRGTSFSNMGSCSEYDGGYYENSSFSTGNSRGQYGVHLVMRYKDNSVWYNYWSPGNAYETPGSPS